MAIFEWDAKKYDALPLPHVQWGNGVVKQLDLAPGSIVVDLGCGTGRDAELLLSLHDDAFVIGVDASVQMLEEFKSRIGDRPDRASTVQLDLQQPFGLTELGLDEPVDAVQSVACFHWIDDHQPLFRSVAAILRQGGIFVAECGGEGNVATVTAAIAAAKGIDADHGWDFEGVEPTRAQLEGAGFSSIDVRLRPDPLTLANREQLEAYLATVILGAELAAMPKDSHRAFVERVADELDSLTIDYVRLEFSAVRG